MASRYPIPARVPPGTLIDAKRHSPAWQEAEMYYSDGSWLPCTVLAWTRHRGGWAALVRWQDTKEEWRMYDRRFMRPRRDL